MQPEVKKTDDQISWPSVDTIIVAKRSAYRAELRRDISQLQQDKLAPYM
jgi:hypothetical protein